MRSLEPLLLMIYLIITLIGSSTDKDMRDNTFPNVPEDNRKNIRIASDLP